MHYRNYGYVNISLVFILSTFLAYSYFANSTSARLSTPSLQEPRSAITLGFRPIILAVANYCFLWLSLCSVVRRTLAWLKFCPSPIVDFLFYPYRLLLRLLTSQGSLLLLALMDLPLRPPQLWTYSFLLISA